MRIVTIVIMVVVTDEGQALGQRAILSTPLHRYPDQLETD